MKVIEAFKWFPGTDPSKGHGIIVSPVLEPTPDNPSGVYGQFTGGTCVPGDWMAVLEDGALINLTQLWEAG